MEYARFTLESRTIHERFPNGERFYHFWWHQSASRWLDVHISVRRHPGEKPQRRYVQSTGPAPLDPESEAEKKAWEKT